MAVNEVHSCAKQLLHISIFAERTRGPTGQGVAPLTRLPRRAKQKTTCEITRFCIDPSLARSEQRTARNQLVSALVEYALSARIATYTAVATTSWFRQISRFGWNCTALGPRRHLMGEDLVGMRIDIDRDTPTALSPRGIYRPTSYSIAALEEAA